MSAPPPYRAYPYQVRYSYTTGAPLPSRITTSPTELLQLSVAFIVLTVDFSLILGYGSLLDRSLGFSALSLSVVAVSALAALTAFVAHEMAHKVAAQRMGAWAEFRYSPIMLLVSLLISFAIGFLFAAPGATVVQGMSDRRQWGRTSLAGPLSNIGFSAVFYAAAVGTYAVGSALFAPLLILAFFNGWFGTFNLVPFGILDGAKVFAWSKAAWAGAIVAAGALAAVTYSALFYGTPLIVR
jgi:Zn-dependent protease